jgi:hypothetical protein
MAKVSVPIEGMLFEYAQLRDKAKSIKSRMDYLATSIKDYVTKQGAVDKNGSYYSATEDFTYGSQAKNSTSLNKERAKMFFTQMDLYGDVIDKVEVINEDKIEKLFNDGKITLDDISALMDIKTSFSIDIKEIKKEEKPEDMPEIQVTGAIKKKSLKDLMLK